VGVAQGVHALKVVGDDEDGQAGASALVQDGDEKVPRGRVEARHGFIEDEDTRVRGEQAGEGDAAHLAAGQVVDAARRQSRVEANEFHGLGDDAVALLAADSALAVRRAGADARPMTGGGEDVGAHGGALELGAAGRAGQGAGREAGHEPCEEDLHVPQWLPYDYAQTCENPLTPSEALEAVRDYLRDNQLQVLHSATQIIIAPGYDYKIVKTIVTNFHQPQSTLLLLVSAFVGGNWRSIYDYALDHGFRFLSYGDSSVLNYDALPS